MKIQFVAPTETTGKIDSLRMIQEFAAAVEKSPIFSDELKSSFNETAYVSTQEAIGLPKCHIQLGKKSELDAFKAAFDLVGVSYTENTADEDRDLPEELDGYVQAVRKAFPGWEIAISFASKEGFSTTVYFDGLDRLLGGFEIQEDGSYKALDR